jgi:hypothetical protein
MLLKLKCLENKQLFQSVQFTVGAFGFALISRPVTAVLASDIQPLTVQVAVIE